MRGGYASDATELVVTPEFVSDGRHGVRGVCRAPPRSLRELDDAAAAATRGRCGVQTLKWQASAMPTQLACPPQRHGHVAEAWPRLLLCATESSKCH